MSSNSPSKSAPRSSRDWEKLLRNSSKLARAAQPRLSRYIPWKPTIPQAAFLCSDAIEAFYGGAAGPGKTVALLMAALQYFDVKGYRALVVRRTFAELRQSKGLMELADEWLRGTGCTWDAQTKTWTSPEGATLTFGYLQHEDDKYQYKGAAFHYIAFDELVDHSESVYRYLFSRLRKLEGDPIPLRMRSASNPGGRGHAWVHRRFIRGKGPTRPFFPGRLDDNPHIDRASYEHSLSYLDDVTRAQLLMGDWTARERGAKFRREWFADKYVDALPQDWTDVVRFWDLAATRKRDEDKRHDPDYTVGELWACAPGPQYYRIDSVRMREDPSTVEAAIKATAAMDRAKYGRIKIRMEQERGASGPTMIAYYARLLTGYSFLGKVKRLDTELLVDPLSTACRNGHVYLFNHPSVSDWFDELEAFPFGEHDDQVVASIGAFTEMANPVKPAAAGRASGGPTSGGRIRGAGLSRGPQTSSWISADYEE